MTATTPARAAATHTTLARPDDVRPDDRAHIMERVIVAGDLAQLTPHERVAYYLRVCESVGLNPLTKPFEYIELNRKLTLYATRACTDQLREIKKVSITRLERDLVDGLCVVTAYARSSDGREDSSTGAVDLGQLKGEARANAMMKAETKAKRRVTLSICGLGWLDESEVPSVPGARVIEVDASGHLGPARAVEPQVLEPDDEFPTHAQGTKIKALWGALGIGGRGPESARTRRVVCGQFAGRAIETWDDLTRSEASAIIEGLVMLERELLTGAGRPKGDVGLFLAHASATGIALEPGTVASEAARFLDDEQADTADFERLGTDAA